MGSFVLPPFIRSGPDSPARRTPSRSRTRRTRVPGPPRPFAPEGSGIPLRRARSSPRHAPRLRRGAGLLEHLEHQGGLPTVVIELHDHERLRVAHSRTVSSLRSVRRWYSALNRWSFRWCCRAPDCSRCAKNRKVRAETARAPGLSDSCDCVSQLTGCRPQFMRNCMNAAPRRTSARALRGDLFWFHRRLGRTPPGIQERIRLSRSEFIAQESVGNKSLDS